MKESKKLIFLEAQVTFKTKTLEVRRSQTIKNWSDELPVELEYNIKNRFCLFNFIFLLQNWI